MAKQFEDDRPRNNRSGPYDRQRQRDRPPVDEPEDIEMRLKSLIIKIGDKASSDLKINLTKMAGILSTDYQKFPETVASTFKSCITELPMKTAVYGTLLGLLNAKNHEVTSRLFDDIVAAAKESLAKSEWQKVKYYVRYFGELVNANVILPAAYLDLLNDLLAAVDEPNLIISYADCMVYIVLAALPWVSRDRLSLCRYRQTNDVLIVR
ncbi:hypothetical protein INT44_001365 [Umbelopsis vinacea]|uniref:MIF4G domain-containing protein n=1 Tax=Umbelopsis vinacea TaxID=44442 RepID=A0A8H7QB54_9FUNG|nr:hypothetical protein INT44_001365 [Umbelopsis vinacea]